MIRVLVADDQELVRTGIRRIVEAEPDLEVVGEAGDGAQAVELTERLEPHVVLMDIRMPGTDGLEAAAAIRARGGASVVVLTTFDLDEYVYRALRAGASGFLLKTSPADQLIHAIRAAAEGDAVLAPSVTRRLVDTFAQQPDPAVRPAGLDRITPRELDVLRMVARGLANSEIAADLVLAPATVKTHVAALLQKLGVRDRVQLVIAAYELGLVAPRATPDGRA
jgi:DNA-binding NarL/FixJ family response regulator